MNNVFYNENDGKVCAWLAQLMRQALIPRGEINGESIQNLRASECAPISHFFAGIGGWPLALALAGWPTDAPVWTGSCPCQPFSIAGKGEGEDDERHVWPYFRDLIAECLPPVIFGEQVASPLGRKWLAGVRVDLEALGYAVGISDLCAAGVAAPGIRQRLYWVADANFQRLGKGGGGAAQERSEARSIEAGELSTRPQGPGPNGRMANARGERLTQGGRGEAGEFARVDAELGSGPIGLANTKDADWRSRECCSEKGIGPLKSRGRVLGKCSEDSWLANAGCVDDECGVRPQEAYGEIRKAQGEEDQRQRCRSNAGGSSGVSGMGNARGERLGEERKCESRSGAAGPSTDSVFPLQWDGSPWRYFDLVPCGDAKVRRVESGALPLAYGLPKGVGRMLAALERMGVDPELARRAVRNAGSRVAEASRSRVGRLRGYGNAIVPELAAVFIKAFMQPRENSLH